MATAKRTKAKTKPRRRKRTPEGKITTEAVLDEFELEPEKPGTPKKRRTRKRQTKQPESKRKGATKKPDITPGTSSHGLYKVPDDVFDESDVMGTRLMAEDKLDPENADHLKKVFKWQRVKKWKLAGKYRVYQVKDPATIWSDFPAELATDPLRPTIPMRGPLTSHAGKLEHAIAPNGDVLPVEYMFRATRPKQWVEDSEDEEDGKVEYFSVWSDGKFLYAESWGADSVSPALGVEEEEEEKAA